MKGTVIRNTGSAYTVRTDGGEEVSCRIKGNFRIKGIRTTNPVAVGDRVVFDEPGPDGVALITAIEPRRNYIIRRASNLSKAASIIAANVDAALLVVTLAHPSTSTTFIDRFLATARAYGVPAILAINKTDLLDDAESRELLDAVAYLYRSIGYQVAEVSAKTGLGLDGLRQLLAGRTTLFSGNSGVGKSSLINGACAGAAAAHGEDFRRPRHRHAHHNFLGNVSSAGRWQHNRYPGSTRIRHSRFRPCEVGHFFPEIFEESHNCRFSNCTHTHEPGCAVLAAVDDCRIAASRYNSYLSIVNDTGDESDKYRKPQ